MKQRTLTFAALLLAPLASACDKTAAWGEANSIIVATSTELWAEVDTLQTALEPRVRTVRDERMFQVSYLLTEAQIEQGQDPFREHWGDLRRFKQILLVGRPEDPWMEPAVKKLRDVPPPPSIARVRDVWARGQNVTVAFVPPQGAAQAVHDLLPELRESFERQYREWATARMFISGRNTELAEALREDAGFGLLVPNVYRVQHGDSVYVFRNDQPDPSELIREITVAWRSGADAQLGTEDLLAWRAELQARQDYPHVVDLSQLQESIMTQHQGRPARQLQAVWTNPPEALWPAGGPFLVRAVPCPEQDRLYLLDAWLYAPGKQKFEFMIQLENILNAFECGG